MAVFNDWQGSLYMIQLLIMRFVVWLGWLSCVALGQVELSEAVTGFVNFPEVGISCIANLAVFITSLTNGRLDLEMGARDVLATVKGPKLEHIQGIQGFGLTTCKCSKYEDASVIMLSFNTPNSSMTQFMKYISNAHNVQSILLRCLFLKSVGGLCSEISNCAECDCECKCIVIYGKEIIKTLLNSATAGTLKQLPDFRLLLPSVRCLKNGCHGYNHGVMVSREDGSEVEVHAAVSEILDTFPQSIQEQHTCICIPVDEADKPNWTKLLIRSFRSKDNEGRGVSVMASDAMEICTDRDHALGSYMARTKTLLREGLIVEYSTASLILPRFTEILTNLLLIGCFKVDGFSSSMAARKAVKDFVVGSEQSGFAANAFLSRALIKSNVQNTHVCQVLTFRGTSLSLLTLSFIAGAVNLICSIYWIILLSLEKSGGKWYEIHSVPPSKPRVVVITVAIFIALGMDCLHLYMDRKRLHLYMDRKRVAIVSAVILLEIGCIVSGSAAAGALATKGFGKWVYGAVQTLVWVKWGIGSYLLGESSASENKYNWASGILVYSSAFLLNSILAGVREEWKYSPRQKLSGSPRDD